MRVAITGSSGLIGSALAESLRSDGHEAVAVARDGHELRWPDGPVDGVVHLSGAPIGGGRWTEERKREIRASRVETTESLVRSLSGLTERPGVLVSGSAIGLYGDRGDEELTEASAPGDGFLASVVQEWEASAAAASDLGMRVAYARTGIVIDPRAETIKRMLPLFKLGLGGPFGSGRQYWSWVTLDDEVAALRWLLDHDVDGPVNITAPNPVTNKTFASTLGRVLHRPALLPVPRFGPALLLGGELTDELLFTSARVLPTALLDSGFAFGDPDLEPALDRMV